MTILGMNFTKIDVEKKGAMKGKVSINNNVTIKEVTAIDISMGSAKQKVLRFDFEFSSKYEPSFGHIKLLGELVFMAGDEKKTKELAEAWKKDKKMPPEVMTPVMNNILSKSNMEAIVLSREINLPPPLPMPKISGQDKDKQYIG